jgi:intein/homing endonuclease
VSGVVRANPYLAEYIEILDMHRAKYKTDAEAMERLSHADSDWIDEEIVHCMGETRYFVSNYFFYRDETHGFRGLYPLLDSQEILHNEYRRLEREFGRIKAMVLKGRQLGVTTYNIAEFFHKTIWTEHANSILVSQDEKGQVYNMGMYESAFDYLPWWMKPRVNRHETGSLYNFDEPDERMRDRRPGLKSFVVSDNANRPSGVGRGMTFRRGLMDELAFWKNPSQLAKALLRSMNAEDGFYVMFSTANGRNDTFHNYWRRAERGEIDWHPIFIPFYRRDKTYFLPIGKDENFVLTEDEKQMRADIQAADNYTIKDGTFKWMRMTKEEFIGADGDDAMFAQEYPCLVGSTRVPTNDGIMSLSELEEHAGRSTGGNPIIGWASKGIKQVFRATTKMGYSIVGTFDHFVPTLDAGDVQLGDLISHAVQLGVPEFEQNYQAIQWKEIFGTVCSIAVDEKTARFLGYFLGDGCYSGNMVSICCDRKDEDVIQDVSFLMYSLFGSCRRKVTGSKKGGIEVQIGCVNFQKVMRKFGIWKDSSPHRRVAVPEVILRSPRAVIREFLRGLFEADGFCGYEGNRVSLFAKGKDFLRDVQLLLLGFGITARFASLRKVNGFGREYIGNALELRAAEARRFCEEIGFISERKRSRQRTIEKKVGRPQAKIQLFDEVVSITPEGDQEVFDITVANSHCFLANGIVVHNCNAIESFQSSAETTIPRRLIHKWSKLTSNPKWVGDIGYEESTGREKLYIRPYDGHGDVPYPCNNTDRFHVWEKPIPKASYSVGVDVALGNDGGDFSAVQVIRLAQGMERDVQVAVWHGHINPSALAGVVAAIGWWYNEALVAVEVNSYGEATNFKLMRQYEYENVYRFKRLDRITNFITNITGWLSTSKSTDSLMAAMSTAFLEDSLVINCKWTMDEFNDYTEEGARGKNAHDDLVDALQIALFCGHEGEVKTASMGKREKTSSQHEPDRYFVHDRWGTRIEKADVGFESLAEAERVAKKYPGSFIQRASNATAMIELAGTKRKVPGDMYNTDYSEIHDDQTSSAHKLHYDRGVPEPDITPQMVEEFEQEQEDLENSAESWKYQ